MYGSTRYDSQFLFIDGTFVKGVTDHSASFSNAKKDIVVAGAGYLQDVSVGNKESSISFKRSLVSSDDFLTGKIGSIITGEFVYGVRGDDIMGKFSFNNGKISSYSISCSVNEIASSDISITSYGDIGGNGTVPSLSEQSYPDPELSLGRSLGLNVSGYDTNRIQSIDYTVSVNYDPKIYLNQMTSNEIKCDIVYPILIESQFVLDVDDYESERLFNLLCSAPTQTLNFSFDDCFYGNTRNFHSPDAELADVSYSSAVGSNMSYTLKYVSKIGDVSELPAILSTLG